MLCTGQTELTTKMFSTTFLKIQRAYYLPVVSDDRSGQHTCEQPTKLSQRVEEGPVVCFHIGALGKHNICTCKCYLQTGQLILGTGSAFPLCDETIW